MEHPPTKCAVCRETPTNHQVCTNCVNTVDTALADLLVLPALATHALLPGSHGDGPGGTGGTKEPPLPCNIEALNLSDTRGTLYELERWERDWRRTFNLEPFAVATRWRATANLRAKAATARALLAKAKTEDTVQREQLLDDLAAIHAQGIDLLRDDSDTETSPEATLAGVIGFLRTWWPHAAAHHPAADEFARAVIGILRQAEHALPTDDGAPEGITITCPADIHHPDTLDQQGNVVPGRTTECGRRLHIDREIVWGGANDEPVIGYHRVICSRCGTDWSVDRLIAVWRSSGQDGWVPIESALKELDTTPRGLAVLVRSGKVARRYGMYRIGACRA